MPTRAEVETVINWTGEDEKAVVYSLMPRIWRLCERAGGELLRVGHQDGKLIWKEFAVEIGAIRIRAPRRRRLSEEERAQRAERLRGVRKRGSSGGFANKHTSAGDPDNVRAGSGAHQVNARGRR